jgi:hypothetical protein
MIKLNDVVKKNKALSDSSKLEVALQALRDKREGKNNQIQSLQKKVLYLENELEALAQYRDRTPQASVIKAKANQGESESAAVVVWSDWHSEEQVLPGQVGGKNEFNLEIFDHRCSQLTHGTISWLSIEQQKTNIKTLVIALLGDYFTNNIHEDCELSCLLQPIEAAYNAQNHIIAAINHVLENTPKDLEILVVCHPGNHSRTTKQQLIANEKGNSLETYMYYVLRDYYKDHAPKRVKFQIAAGYHSTTTFFDRFTIRWHHGHQIKYSGGVGGLTIPVNKAIAQWNKAEWADLDVFGHFHQAFDGGNFICNGSLIGYNAFAIAIKGGFELPQQTFFLVNKRWNKKTMVAPIFLE